MSTQTAASIRGKVSGLPRQKCLWKALVLFLLVALVYWASLFLAMLAPLWAIPLLLIVNGTSIAVLLVIGHDACHRAYLSNPTLEKLVGRLSFLPSLWVYSTWRVSHNYFHHGFTNVREFDTAWVPLTVDEYNHLGLVRRWYYRHTRTLLGFATHWIRDVWWVHSMVPTRDDWQFLKKRKLEYATEVFMVCLFAACQIWLVVHFTRNHQLHGIFGMPFAPIVSVLVFLGIPFWCYAFLAGFVTFVQHTHPASIWFKNKEDWTFFESHIRGTVHFLLPFPLNRVFLNIMEHNAHHVDTAIPLYNLIRPQRALESEYPDDIVIEQYSLETVKRITSHCQLYDYENRQWVGYDGTPRLESTISS